MELKKFEELLKGNNAIRLTEDLILFNDLELYSFNKSAGIQFKRFKAKNLLKLLRKHNGHHI